MTTVKALGTQVVYDPENEAYLDSRHVYTRGAVGLKKGLKGTVIHIENRGIFSEYVEVKFANSKTAFTHCNCWKKRNEV